MNGQMNLSKNWLWVWVFCCALMGSLSFGAEDAVQAGKRQTDAASPFKQNWPCFRGPGNIGHAGPGDWPTRWTVATQPGEENRNVVWKTEIPIEGKSSPIVWENSIFLTGGNASEQRVLCVDRLSGGIRWNVSVRRAGEAPTDLKVFERTGFAASTPTTDGERVYALFANGILVAFDFNGEQVWVRDLGTPESLYSFAGSLILYKKVLLIQFDQGKSAEKKMSKLFGIDATTGDTLWTTPRPVPNSWSSPALIRTADRVELITCAAPWIIAYDPENGGVLWQVEGLAGDVAPSPAFGGGLVFVTNEAARLLAIRPGGKGNVGESHVVWETEEGLPDVSSPVSDNKRLLQAAAGGFLTCWDTGSGEMAWEHYLPAGASSSPILAGGVVYLSCEDGVTHVFRLGDQYEPVGRGDTGEAIYATPAFADSRIYIRGEKHLICIEEKP